MPKVLITDKINKAAGDILSAVAQVDFIETLSEDDLAVKIADYDALMIRSQTKVTAKIIEAGKNLSTINGKYIQIRTKDSGGNHPIYSKSADRYVSHCNYAIYIMKDGINEILKIEGE